MTPAATLSIARSFHLASEKCRGSGLPADQGVPNAIVPSIVCLAFAIEVGLKAISFASNSPTSGHRLDKLFEALPEADRMKVLFHSGVEESSFEQNLEQVASAFVEWRYIYEQRGVVSISEQFLQMLWFAVESVAAEKAEQQREALRRDA